MNTIKQLTPGQTINNLKIISIQNSHNVTTQCILCNDIKIKTSGNIRKYKGKWCSNCYPQHLSIKEKGKIGALYHAILNKRNKCVDPEFHNPHAFFSYVANLPNFNLDMSLDRINNNLGYIKGNLRWADNITQANNTSKNRLITYNNITLTLKQWANIKNINYQTLRNRINKKWTIHNALNTNINKNKAHTTSGRKPKPIICINNNKIYKSVKLAAIKLNVSETAIYTNLNNKNITVGQAKLKFIYQ